MTERDPFKSFHCSPEIIRLAVMIYVRFTLSLWNVETCCKSAVLISAMKLSGSGGTALDRKSPLKSAAIA